MVTWNTRDLTIRALRNLLDSDQGVDLRVFVLDNGSTDGSANAIGAAVPEAELVRSTDNTGFAAGTNRLLRQTTSEWVFVINSDAWPRAAAIGRLHAVGEQDPTIGAVAPRVESSDGSQQLTTLPFPSPLMSLAVALGERGSARLPAAWARRRLVPGAWHQDEARDVDWAIGAALLLRRACIDDVGLLDERYFMYAEDLEWCWRARRRGWTTRFEPDAVVEHVGNASGELRWGEARDRVMWDNAYDVVSRYAGRGSELAQRGINAAGSALAWRRAGRPGGRPALRHALRTHLSRRPPSPPAAGG